MKYQPTDSTNNNSGSTQDVMFQKDLTDVLLARTESSSEVMAGMSIAMSAAMAQTLGRSSKLHLSRV